MVAMAVVWAVPLTAHAASAGSASADVVQVSTRAVSVAFSVDKRTELRLDPTTATDMRFTHGRFAGALVSRVGGNTYAGYLFEATARHGIQILPLGDRSSLTLTKGNYRVELLGSPATPIRLLVRYGRLRITSTTNGDPVRYWAATGVTGPTGSWDQPLPEKPSGANVLATVAAYGADPVLLDAAFCVRPRSEPPCNLASNGRTYGSTGSDEIRLEAGGHAPRLVASAYSGELASAVASDGDWAVVVIDDPG